MTSPLAICSVTTRRLWAPIKAASKLETSQGLEREAFEKSRAPEFGQTLGIVAENSAKNGAAPHLQPNAATLSNCLFYEWVEWCPETESNRHVLLGTRDFKSRASASFAIRALLRTIDLSRLRRPTCPFLHDLVTTLGLFRCPALLQQPSPLPTHL